VLNGSCKKKLLQREKESEECLSKVKARLQECTVGAILSAGSNRKKITKDIQKDLRGGRRGHHTRKKTDYSENRATKICPVRPVRRKLASGVSKTMWKRQKEKGTLLRMIISATAKSTLNVK